MLELLSYGFMQRALVAGAIVALASSLLGVFLILRRMALIGDGFSHIALGGIALGLFLNTFAESPVFLVALGFSALSALAIVKLKESAGVHGDVSIGIVFSFALALGVVLISLAHGFSVDLHYFLFGNIISVSMEDVAIASTIGLLVLGLLLVHSKELMYICFDEISARVSGVDVSRLNTMLIVLTAITVVMSIRIVGILLISSFLIIPPAAALQVSRSFRGTLALSAAFGLASLISGLALSFIFDLASGGAVVLSSIGIFVIAWLLRRYRGV